MAEVAAYFKLTQDQEFAAIDSRHAVGRDIFSTVGIQSVHEWLVNTRRLGEPAQSSGGCGV